MGTSNGDEDGDGVDGDGSGGALPRPGRVPEQRFMSPRTRVDDGGGYGTFRGRRLMYLEFSGGRL